METKRKMLGKDERRRRRTSQIVNIGSSFFSKSVPIFGPLAFLEKKIYMLRDFDFSATSTSPLISISTSHRNCNTLGSPNNVISNKPQSKLFFSPSGDPGVLQGGIG